MTRYLQYRKKKDVLLSPITKATTPTEKSKKQRDNIKMPPKDSITQQLRTDLRRSVGEMTTTLLMWLKPV